MSADTIERPKAGKNSAAAKGAPEVELIVNLLAIQALIDAAQRDLELPTVIPGVPPVMDMNYHAREKSHSPFCPGCTDDEIRFGKAVPRRACDLDENGDVIFGTGVVVTKKFAVHLQQKIIPKILQQMHRTLSVMSRSLNSEGRGVVEDPAKVLMPIPDADW